MPKASSEAGLSGLVLDIQTVETPLPPADCYKIFVKSGGLYIVDHDGTVTGPFGSAAGLTNETEVLAAPVTLTNADTFYDVLTISLTAGTWLVTANCAIYNAAAADFCVKLWDGSTVYGAASASTRSSNDPASVSITALITLAITTNIKISAAADDVSMIASTYAGRSGIQASPATLISAVRIG